MTGEIDQEQTLREGLESAMETADTLDPKTEGAPEVIETPPVPAELPPLEAPAMWGKQYKETFAQIAQTPEQRAVAERWLEQWKETQGYITKRDQEYAEYRKRFDPISEIIRPYEGYWAQQGMSPDAGIRQVLSYAEALARDPASTIPQLAQMYGVDLASLVAEQPYIPPEVQTLQQRLQQVEAYNQQMQQQQQQQYYSRLNEEIRAFQTAADEQGNPLHPHFDRVFDHMVKLSRGGMAQNIQQAYELAIKLDTDLQAEIAAENAKKEAAARAAEVNKAVGASKTVKSKSVTETVSEKSIRDTLAERLAEAGYTDH